MLVLVPPTPAGPKRLRPGSVSVYLLWLELKLIFQLLLCGECPKQIELNEQYNSDYYETDRYDYADNYYRKRRSEQFDVCTCQLNTNYASGIASIYLDLKDAVVSNVCFLPN